MDQRNQPTSQEWSQCPFCKSQDIEGDSIQVEGPETWQEVSCQRCDGNWTEIYEANRRIDLVPGSPVTSTVYVDAKIGIETDLDDKVVSVTVIPSEGQPGYMGFRQGEDVWAAVNRHLRDNRMWDGKRNTELFAMRWEG